MKRRTETLRSPQEQRADNQRDYTYMVKKPNNINPIFLNKPYEAVK